MSHVPVSWQCPGWNTHTYIYPFLLRYFGPLGRMPHFSPLILFLILIQLGNRGKWNYTIHGKIVMPEHIHIHIYIHFYIDRFLSDVRTWNIVTTKHIPTAALSTYSNIQQYPKPAVNSFNNCYKSGLPNNDFTLHIYRQEKWRNDVQGSLHHNSHFQMSQVFTDHIYTQIRRLTTWLPPYPLHLRNFRQYRFRSIDDRILAWYDHPDATTDTTKWRRMASNVFQVEFVECFGV
jgi:hypothetical protein